MKDEKKPADSHGSEPQVIDIPSQYGDNKIVLMVRDPWTIFSYWEIRQEVEDAIKASIRERALKPVKSVLRVYRVTGDENSAEFSRDKEFELRDWASSWYVHVDEPGKEWVVDIGIVADNGEFFCLARSNRVCTPAHSMSETCTGEWMCPEELYYRVFEASGAGQVGKSSMEIKEFMDRYLREWLSSGGVTSGMFSSPDIVRRKR